jgi:hypothetical protein
MTIVKSLDWDNFLVDNPDLAVMLGGHQEGTLIPEDVEINHSHATESQHKFYSIDPKRAIMVMPRGTGKSEKILAKRAIDCLTKMPRSRIALVGVSYAKLLENVLPAIVKGMESYGWVRNQDFWIRERPPKRLGIPAPYVGSLKSEHTIYTRLGSVMSLISQDREGSANSMTLHAVIGDELKLLDKPSLDSEIAAANRGDEFLFPDCPLFHSEAYTTDMPTEKESMWILEQDALNDAENVQLLLDLQLEIWEQSQELLTAAPVRRKGILKEIQNLQKLWDQLRAVTFWYYEPKGHDNIDGFGKANIVRLFRTLPDFIFKTSILNVRPFLTADAFYPDLKKSHSYILGAVDYGVIDNIPFELLKELDDCRKDADLDHSRPLSIGMDFGASISCMAIGQKFGKKLRVQNAMYVKHPQRLNDLLQQFCHYYRTFRTKRIRFYYDHTATGSNAQTRVTYADDVEAYLTKEGWKVERVYIGKTASPMKRYEMWGRSLRGGDEHTPECIFNRMNCLYLLTAMRLARLKQGSNRFEKDKSDEKKLSTIDQRETTHFTDAVDTLLVGETKHVLKEHGLNFNLVFLS